LYQHLKKKKEKRKKEKKKKKKETSNTKMCFILDPFQPLGEILLKTSGAVVGGQGQH